MNDNGYQRKVSEAEALFVGVILLVLDAIEIVLDIILAPIGGDELVNIAGDTLFLPFIWYCYIKGLSKTPMIIAAFVEIIPWVGDISPSKTIGWCVTVYQDWHPESMASKAVSATVAAAQAREAKLNKGGQAVTQAERRQIAREMWAESAKQYRSERLGTAQLTGGPPKGTEKRPSQQLPERPASTGAPTTPQPQGASLSSMLGEHENELERFQSQVFQTPGQQPAAANDNTPVQNEEMAQAA